MEAVSERSKGGQRSVSAWQPGRRGAGARRRAAGGRGWHTGPGVLAGAGGHRNARQSGAWAGALPRMCPPSHCHLRTGALTACPSGAKQSRRTGAVHTLLTPLSKHESARTALFREHAHPHARSGMCLLGPPRAATGLSPRGLRPGLTRPDSRLQTDLGRVRLRRFGRRLAAWNERGSLGGVCWVPGSRGRGLPESSLLAGGHQAGALRLTPSGRSLGCRCLGFPRHLTQGESWSGAQKSLAECPSVGGFTFSRSSIGVPGTPRAGPLGLGSKVVVSSPS